jgi:hypothetical protein
MKTVKTLSVALLLLIGAQSCTVEESRYVDLNTGTPFTLVKDPHTGLMVDVETGKPLNIYVDLATQDTIDGRTGTIINGQVKKIDKSLYVYTGSTSAAQMATIQGGTPQVKQIAYNGAVNNQ